MSSTQHRKNSFSNDDDIASSSADLNGDESITITMHVSYGVHEEVL